MFRFKDREWRLSEKLISSSPTNVELSCLLLNYLNLVLIYSFHYQSKFNFPRSFDVNAPIGGRCIIAHAIATPSAE